MKMKARLKHSNLRERLFRAFHQNHDAALNTKLALKQQHYRLHCEKKTIRTIMLLLVCFALSWTPYLVVCIIGLFGDLTMVTYKCTIITSLIAKTSTVLNPLLYSITHPKVRKRILQMLQNSLPTPFLNLCSNTPWTSHTAHSYTSNI